MELLTLSITIGIPTLKDIFGLFRNYVKSLTLDGKYLDMHLRSELMQCLTLFTDICASLRN